MFPAELPEPEPEDDDPDEPFVDRWSVTAFAHPLLLLPLLLAVVVVVHAFLAVVLKLCPTLNDFTSCPICVFEAFDMLEQTDEP